MYETYLFKKYHPIKRHAGEAIGEEDVTKQNCQIDLSEIKPDKTTKISASYLLSKGKTVELNISDKKLNLECQKTEEGKFQLKFFKELNLSVIRILKQEEAIELEKIFEELQLSIIEENKLPKNKYEIRVY